MFRYTNIGQNAQRFNISTNDFASEDEIVEASSPKNLKSNSARFSYIFFPKQYLFFYEGYYNGNSFGPRNKGRLCSLQRVFICIEKEVFYG
ncbi:MULTISPECIES: DUF4747 family protein [Alteromonadales]|uniref:DUF4747 family protein n=1 Tax=Alteromonadales TaxID=135622 RepID=UPI00339F16D4